MKALGKALTTLCLLALTLAAGNSLAAVTASLDRNMVALGDTLRLSISADAGEDVALINLRPLERDFEILQRSTSSNTQIINGRRTDTRKLVLDITPRREGTLEVPPLRLGNNVTNSLPVSVGPPPRGDSAGQTVLFEAELDRDAVYVQGQVILTLRVQQAINLEDRSITDLQLDDAFVRPLEQKSYQRTMAGRPWLVHELRYAISPEKSGTLEIPAITFAAREAQQRRSLFDLGGGRQLRRSTQPLTIEVLPRPDSFPASTWLPARKLSLEETWSRPPEELRVGESATRTIRIQAEGLQGAQLPPVLFKPVDGLKYYPDQPEITDTETSTGLAGSRLDSAALVPTRPGTVHIPEVRIPWWDTEAEQVRYAVLPGRDLTVAAAPATIAAAPSTLPAPVSAAAPTAAVPVVNTSTLLWQIISAVTGLGWLLTLAYLFRSRRRLAKPARAEISNTGEKTAFQQLLKSCTSNDPAAARASLILWAASRFPAAGVVSLDQVAALWADPALDAEIASLNAALYRDGLGGWEGDGLARCVRRLRDEGRQRSQAPEPGLELYPRPA